MAWEFSPVGKNRCKVRGRREGRETRRLEGGEGREGRREGMVVEGRDSLYRRKEERE